MAIRYTREYDQILDDLSRAIATVPDFYDAFEMEAADWEELSDDERSVCVRTLADDIFYALGADPEIPVGTGTASYDASHGFIKVAATDQLVHVIPLRE
ncbi:hypothetical protein ACFPVX_00625 [Cohnella faecalis]|nr:hypothetical protein [Cohnella faecalis]